MKSKSKKEILTLISELRSSNENFVDHKQLHTRYNNNIRILQWTLGLRTRWYPESQGLMQNEDRKALDNEIKLRKSLMRKK